MASNATSKPARRRIPAILVIGAMILALMALLAIVGPMVWGAGASSLGTVMGGKASSAHPLGTDALGRDVLARTLVATRPSIVMAALATAIAVGGGLVLGATIVLAGRRVRAVGERLIDLLVAYPPIVVALAITAIFMPSETSVVIAIGLAFTPQFARLTNTLAASISERDYVTVGHLLGLRPLRLLRRHILPNLAGPLLVLTSVGFASAIITLSGLSFIGLGVQQPQFDWGTLLSLGLQDINVNPVEVVGPGLAILLTGLAAGLVGDGLNHYLDPRQPVGRVRRRPYESSDAGPAAANSTGAAALSRLGAPVVDDVVVAVQDLRISSLSGSVGVPLVRGVSLEIKRGEVVGLVGESGSGKTLTAMAIARLLPPGLMWSACSLQVAGSDVSDPGTRPPKKLATDLGIVFQDPSSCFNPARHIGPQITEVARVHGGLGSRAASEAAIERLREVQISSPELRMHQYPHELSGGMRQRAMIAMALMSSPELIVADEPTTALDVTVQAEVLRLLRRLNDTHGTALLLISHDIKVISALCDRVCVMYAGRIVELLSVEDLHHGRVYHPYTKALLAAVPKTAGEDRNEPLIALPGRPPQPGTPITGCSFVSRCPMAEERCSILDPHLRDLDGHGVAACHVTTGPLEDSIVRG